MLDSTVVIDNKGKPRTNFKFLRVARGIESTPPRHKGAKHWNLTKAILVKAHKAWRQGKRGDTIVSKLRRYSTRKITFYDLRREWLALGLDTRTPITQRDSGARQNGFALLVQSSGDLQRQLAQETGLARETVRARALRAIFIYGIDLHDPELILEGDPDEKELLPATKEP